MKKSKAHFMNYIPFIAMTILVYLSASIVFALLIKDTSAIPVFITFCIIQCVGIILFAILPQRFKPVPRHASKFLVGMTLLVLAGILGRQNFQIEGFWYCIFAGFFGGPIVHFCMKIIGTLINGRSWCGWGCWTAAILDLFPYNHDTRWRGNNAKYVRYVHFIVSIAITALIFFVLKHVMQGTGTNPEQNWAESITAVYWIVLGNLLYYGSGIILAVTLKDNRAFCKYLCPVSVLLKGAALFSLVRIKGKSSTCGKCKKCEQKCPASIAIHSYVEKNKRVTSTECLMCLACVAECPEGNLKTSIGCDMVKKEYLIK